MCIEKYVNNDELFLFFAQYGYKAFVLLTKMQFFLLKVLQCVIFSALLWLTLYSTEGHRAAGKLKEHRGCNMELPGVT